MKKKNAATQLSYTDEQPFSRFALHFGEGTQLFWVGGEPLSQKFSSWHLHKCSRGFSSKERREVGHFRLPGVGSAKHKPPSREIRLGTQIGPPPRVCLLWAAPHNTSQPPPPQGANSLKQGLVESRALCLSRKRFLLFFFLAHKNFISTRST